MLLKAFTAFIPFDERMHGFSFHRLNLTIDTLFVAAVDSPEVFMETRGGNRVDF
jgi:hypothetical protein